MKHIKAYKIFESNSEYIKDIKEILHDLEDFEDFEVKTEEYESDHGDNINININIDKGWSGSFLMTNLLKSTLIRFNNLMRDDWTIVYQYTPYNHGGTERFYVYDDERGIRANCHRLVDEKIWFIKIIMKRRNETYKSI